MVRKNETGHNLVYVPFFLTLTFKVLEEYIGDPEGLSQLEGKYIAMYKDTICNKHSKDTWSSSNKKNSSYIRRKINIGEKNPNCKHDPVVIQQILWLKEHGYSNKQIAEFFPEVRRNYISDIGKTRWIHLEPVKPDFLNKEQEFDEVYENKLLMFSFSLGIIGLLLKLNKLRCQNKENL